MIALKVKFTLQEYGDAFGIPVSDASRIVKSLVDEKRVQRTVRGEHVAYRFMRGSHTCPVRAVLHGAVMDRCAVCGVPA